MLTRKFNYGLKAMLTLAREHGRGPILISDLAEHDAIPTKFLENILLMLKHRGLVQSRKGPHISRCRCRCACSVPAAS